MSTPDECEALESSAPAPEEEEAITNGATKSVANARNGNIEMGGDREKEEDEDEDLFDTEEDVFAAEDDIDNVETAPEAAEPQHPACSSPQPQPKIKIEVDDDQNVDETVQSTPITEDSQSKSDLNAAIPRKTNHSAPLIKKEETGGKPTDQNSEKPADRSELTVLTATIPRKSNTSSGTFAAESDSPLVEIQGQRNLDFPRGLHSLNPSMMSP
jgi:hypothetical protein